MMTRSLLVIYLQIPLRWLVSLMVLMSVMGNGRLAIAQPQSWQQDIPDLYNQATQLNQSDRYPEALELYEQALGVARQEGDRYREAAILLAIGDLFSTRLVYRDDSIASWPYVTEALDIYEELGDRQRQAEQWWSLGDLSRTAYFRPEILGEAILLSDVIAPYSQALDIYQELGDRQAQAALFDILLQQLHVVEFYDQYLIWLQEEDLSGQADALFWLGANYLCCAPDSHRSLAIASLEQSLDLYRELEHLAGLTNVLHRLGLAYSSDGDVERAITALQEAIVLAQSTEDPTATELSNPEALALVLKLLGDLYQQQGQISEAIATLESAQLIYQEIGNTQAAADMARELDQLYRQLDSMPAD